MHANQRRPLKDLAFYRKEIETAGPLSEQTLLLQETALAQNMARNLELLFGAEAVPDLEDELLAALIHHRDLIDARLNPIRPHAPIVLARPVWPPIWYPPPPPPPPSEPAAPREEESVDYHLEGLQRP